MSAGGGSPVLRVRYRIDGPVRFVGSRDLCRLWERAVRRAGVPVAMSQGFTPRPRIAFGLALPTCAESSAEYVDIRLSSGGEHLGSPDPFGPLDSPDDGGSQVGAGVDVRVGAWVEAIDGGLPDGIDVTGVDLVDTGEPSLQESVAAVTWALWGLDRTVADLRSAAAMALAAEHLFIERERKGVRSVDDVRGHLLDLAVIDPAASDAAVTDAVMSADVTSPDVMSTAVMSADVTSAVAASAGAAGAGPIDEPVIVADVSTAGRSVRPLELAAVVFGIDDPVRIRRLAQWLDDDGTRREVVPTHAARTTAGSVSGVRR